MKQDPVAFLKKLMTTVFYPEVNVDYNVHTKKANENLTRTKQFPPEQKLVLKSMGSLICRCPTDNLVVLVSLLLFRVPA